jgi:hypothetical protein
MQNMKKDLRGVLHGHIGLRHGSSAVRCEEKRKEET